MSTRAMEPPAGATAAVPAVRQRIDSIDLLRGLVIVLMALDHVRDFFSEVRFDPLDLAQTSAALFATRWITHFCAPVFIFLAGTSAYRVARRATPAELSRFLLTRGAWLIVLEVTVVSFAWTFTAPWATQVYLQVIWAIGWCMVVLAALVRLPVRAVVAIGLLLVAGHNALDGLAPAAFGALAPLWSILHVAGPMGPVFVAYPLLPWIGVMAAGYGFGALYDWEPHQRRRALLALGLGAIALFLLLRLPNAYGDPQPWEPQASGLFTVFAVLNVHKYPPSLLYLCVTLGPALLVLAAAERWQGRLSGALVTIGRVPLFFYVAHLYLAHLAASVLAHALGLGMTLLTGHPEDPVRGFSLPIVYLAWIAVVLALYPACRWFAAIKARRRDWWLSYL